MKTGVVIITRNRPVQIKQCLNSLINQILKPDELIIIDSSATNDTRTVVLAFKKKVQFKIVYEKIPHISISYSRNMGLKKAKSEIIVFTDDDCQVPNNWIKEIVKSHKQFKKACIIGGKVINHNKKNYWAVISSNLLAAYLKFPGKIHEEIHLTANNLSMKKEIIKKTKLDFDEYLLGIEDVDFCIRAEKLNLKVLYNPQIIVSHDFRTSFSGIVSQWFFYGKANFLFYKKYKYNILQTIRKEIFWPDKISSFFIRLVWLSGLGWEFTIRKASNKVFLLARWFNNNQLYLTKFLKFSKTFGYPKELFIEPTNICNAKCPLCPTGTGKLKREKGYMSFETFKKIIDEVRFYSQTIYLWNLGEPFLNEDIFKMISYAKKFGLFVMSSTNGYAFKDKQSIAKLIDSGLDRLIVGIDGIDQQTFSKYRKGLRLNLVLKGLEQLNVRKRKLKVDHPWIDFQFIVMKHNQNQIKQASVLAKKLGTHFRPKFLSMEMVDNKNPQNWLPDKDTLRIYKQSGNEFMLKRKMINNTCTAWDSMVINWDGTVNPCIFDYYSNIVLGKIPRSSVHEIWTVKKFTDFRRKVLMNRSDVKICRTCPIEENCSEEFII